jgi:hypothetical protein
VIAHPLQTPPPDDPKWTWPVYLGTLVRDRSAPPGERLTVEDALRPYVGLSAEALDHPGHEARLELGRRSTESVERVLAGRTVRYKADPNRRFAVFVPEDATDLPAREDGEILPRLELSKDGDLRVRGGATVRGSVRLDGGAVEFVAAQPEGRRGVPSSPAIYRISDESGDSLRLDLGTSVGTPRSLVIGYSAPDGSFVPCLKVEPGDAGSGTPAGRVTVYGDLIVEGQLEADRPEVILSEDARRAIEASFMAGILASHG